MWSLQLRRVMVGSCGASLRTWWISSSSSTLALSRQVHTPAIYYLQVVAHHGGTAHTRHYMAFALDMNDSWCRYNDATISTATEPDASTSWTYVLLPLSLRRRDVLVVGGGSVSAVWDCLRIGRTFVYREATNVARRWCPCTIRWFWTFRTEW